VTSADGVDSPLNFAALADVVAQFPSFIAVYEGEALRCVLANDVARAIVGGRDFVGLPLRQALPEFETQNIVDMVERVFDTGAAAEAREWRVQLADPRLPEPVEVFANFTAVPWRSPDGSLRGVITTGNVVTDMVKARQAAATRAAESEQRYQQARADVANLQRALLPAGLPVLPATIVSARYLVAATEQAAGGDWFDSVVLDDYRLALTVGDVVGHGIDAAAAMAQLRAVLLELLTAGAGLPDVLGRLSAFAGRTPSTRAATVCVALLDQNSGAVEYVTMGHPPPLIVRADLRSAYLEPTGGGPLGTSDATVIVGAAQLDAGDVLVLYSDGILERPGRSFDTGLVDFQRVAGAAAGNQLLPTGAPASAADRICDQTVEVLTRSGYADDVTVLAAERRTREAEPLTIEVSPESSELRTVRDKLGAWLIDFGVDIEAVFDLQLAATEALTNAIEHGHGHSRGGTIRLRATVLRNGRFRCTVTDEGQWREPEGGPSVRGRGLTLIRSFTDDLVVHHDEQGTTVTFERVLQRPPTVAAATGRPVPVSPEPDFAIDAEHSPRRLLRVRGAIDAATVGRFTAALRALMRGGTASVVVDLTAVTHLASVGVRVLHETSGEGDLRLHAPVGTSTRAVVDLVGLSALVSEVE
jgi:serine phosphatase RsbU (regulator of sigma subunit)/anti-sigma regulatory factor (Ser/Thr protein kinase)/anti-anti-sigma regulatory factor